MVSWPRFPVLITKATSMRSIQIPSAILLALLLSPTPAATQQLPPRTNPSQSTGVIFATDSQGQPRDLFQARNLVYLSTGAAIGNPCAGHGLADGAYYFQVTNPSGTALLSKDPVSRRRLEVVGGQIVRGPISAHALRNGPCGSKLMQLQPFLDSPGSDFEYRVWLTPVSEYAYGSGMFGFSPSNSKSGSFKIDSGVPPVTQTKISGHVFYDFNENGVYEPQVDGEVPLAGWKIQIESNGVTTEIFTDADGRYEFLRDMDATHHLLTSIAPPPGFIPNPGGRWEATTPNPVDVLTDVDHVSVDFGNLFFVNTTQFARSKGYWHNQGHDDLQACDPAWRIALNDLCLRNDNTSPPDTVEHTLFTVPLDIGFEEAFTQLGDYLVGDSSSGVLAYVLSTQFTAANLNLSCGPLHDLPTFIDQMNNDVLVDLDQMVINTHALLCDPRSANTGPDGDQEWRAQIMMCLHEWNGMNTTGTNTFTRRPTPGAVQY